MDNVQNNTSQQDGSFDWKNLVTRKERPLPKVGCRWAFYIALLLLIVFLVVMFVKYKSVDGSDKVATIAMEAV